MEQKLIPAPVTTLANDWIGPDAGKATTLYQPNYIYVRAKNLCPSGTSAKIELYHFPSTNSGNPRFYGPRNTDLDTHFL